MAKERSPHEPRTEPLPLSGMHAGGAPQLLPAGKTRLMQNMVARPGPRWEKRSPFVSADYLDGKVALGYALWHNITTGRIETVLARTGVTTEHQLRTTEYPGLLFDDTFTGPVGHGVLTSYTNYRGILYYCMSENYTGSGRVPAGLHSFDGATIAQYPLGGETLSARCIATYIERLFLGYVRATVTNQFGATAAYDLSGWSNVTTTVENITNGSTVTCRVTPTATTLSQRYKRDIYTVAASTTETTVALLSQLRNTSPAYEMPMTVDLIYSEIWVTATAYVLGDIRVPTAAAGNGFHYRVTVAGTAAAGEPAWPTTIGTTVVDGTVTWICAGKEAVASVPLTLQTATQQQKPIGVIVRGVFNAQPRPVKVGARIKFGTTAVATIELHAVEVSFKDGLADGDLRKANWGQQITVGKFAYPFFNVQSSGSAVIDLHSDIYWTEPSDPNTIRADNFQRLREAPGPVTAMCVAGNRLIVFKRRGMWVFAMNEDFRIPIIREQFIANVGCKGPRAVTVHEGRVYFIGNPNEVYVYEVGGEPRPLCGDAMRDRLFMEVGSFGFATTDPNQDTNYSLAVDDEFRDLYVTCKSQETAVLHLDSGDWSILKTNVGDAPLGTAFQCLLWNPELRAMYTFPSDGVTGVDAMDTSSIISGHLSRLSPGGNDYGPFPTEYVVDAYIQFRPLATLFPKKEIQLHDVGLLNMSTEDPEGQTSKIEISLDGGVTWTKSATFVISIMAMATVAKRLAVRGLGQTSADLAVRLYHSGFAGGGSLRLAAADVVISEISEGAEERVTTNATITAATL